MSSFLVDGPEEFCPLSTGTGAEWLYTPADVGNSSSFMHSSDLLDVSSEYERN